MILRHNKKPAALTRQEAMSVRPIQLVQAETTATPEGLRLKVPLKSTRWSGWLGLPEGATKTFELDALGAFIWNNCDGKTTVQQMIQRLAKERRLTLREVEVATLQFLQTLTRKGLVGMPIVSDKKAGARS